MAVQTVTLAQLLRDSYVHSTGHVTFTTSSGFAVQYDPGDKVAFLVCWTGSSGIDEQRWMKLTLQPGDYWRSGIGSLSFTIETCSSAPHHWLFGPFDQARFGLAATSSGLVELNSVYLDVFTLAACSSNCSSTGADLATKGVIQIHAFAMPEVAYAT